MAHLDNESRELSVRQLVVGEYRYTIAVFDPRGEAVVDRLGDDIDAPTLLDEPLCEVNCNFLCSSVGEGTAVYECESSHFGLINLSTKVVFICRITKKRAAR